MCRTLWCSGLVQVEPDFLSEEDEEVVSSACKSLKSRCPNRQVLSAIHLTGGAWAARVGPIYSPLKADPLINKCAPNKYPIWCEPVQFNCRFGGPTVTL